jgi:hypothetical protein
MEGCKGQRRDRTKAVQSFVSAWHTRAAAQGYVSGVYGSATSSTMRDVAALGAAKPDNAWIANWNGVEDVFGDPYVSDALWPNHQRVHQYKGGHKETYGGVTINIDSDYVDGAVVGGSVAVPPPPPPAQPPAGSVGSGDGKATATWVAGSFDTTAVVTLTPTTAASPTGYGVRLTVTDPDRRSPWRASAPGARPPADADRRARALLVGRRHGLEAAAQVTSARCRPVSTRATLDPDGRSRSRRSCRASSACCPTRRRRRRCRRLRLSRALAPSWPGDRQHGTWRATRCCSTERPCRRCREEGGA